LAGRPQARHPGCKRNTFVESEPCRNVSVTIQQTGRNIQTPGIVAGAVAPAVNRVGDNAVMSREKAESGHAHVLRELNEERAAALARIARRLDGLLNSLRELRAQAERTATEERGPLRIRYDALREQALEYRWYLEVQRESIGIRSHAMLEELYPVPGELK
jgi:hypothetical protein